MKKYLLLLSMMMIALNSFSRAQENKEKSLQPIIMKDANYGFYYTDTTTCNEGATAEIVNWCNANREQNNKRNNLLEKQIVTLTPKGNIIATNKRNSFRQAVNNEIKAWKRLEELLHNFSNITFEIDNLLVGGSLLHIQYANIHSEISYARFACLLDNMNTLKGLKQKQLGNKQNLLLNQLYRNMESHRPIIKPLQIKQTCRPMSMAEAKKEAQRLTTIYPTSTIKTFMNAWLKARKNVSLLLVAPYQSAYDQHTALTIHSLICNFFY